MSEPIILLVRPQLVENIGTTARAMMNCGLMQLRLVAPRDPWPLSATLQERMEAASSGADQVLAHAKLYETLPEAIADCTRVYASTARPRDMIKEVLTPRAAMQELHGFSQAGEKIGLLFGPERTGLSNEEITLASKIITIPANAEFSSFNLAQSVLVLAYEWMLLARGAMLTDGTLPSIEPHHEQLHFNGQDRQLDYGKTRPANQEELHYFFHHLESELETHGFFTSLDMKPTMVQNLRNALVRANFTEQEVRTWHGVIAALTKSVIR